MLLILPGKKVREFDLHMIYNYVYMYDICIVSQFISIDWREQ